MGILGNGGALPEVDVLIAARSATCNTENMAWELKRCCIRTQPIGMQRRAAPSYRGLNLLSLNLLVAVAAEENRPLCRGLELELT
jgi:hypothetical protein